MIVHLNFLPASGATDASNIVTALFGLLDQGRLDPELLPTCACTSTGSSTRPTSASR